MSTRAHRTERNTGFPETVFITRRLTQAEAEHFMNWAEQGMEVLHEEVLGVLSMGVKLSLSWDDYNQSFIATATDRIERSPNKGHALSSRSDSWYEALLMTVYKIVVIAAGKNWKDIGDRSDWG